MGVELILIRISLSNFRLFTCKIEIYHIERKIKINPKSKQLPYSRFFFKVLKDHYQEIKISLFISSVAAKIASKYQTKLIKLQLEARCLFLSIFVTNLKQWYWTGTDYKISTFPKSRKRNWCIRTESEHFSNQKFNTKMMTHIL